MYLAIIGSCQKFRVGLGLNPFETKDRVIMTISYFADANVCETFSHVPQRNLTIHQATRKQLSVFVMELDGGYRTL